MKNDIKSISELKEEIKKQKIINKKYTSYVIDYCIKNDFKKIKYTDKSIYDHTDKNFHIRMKFLNNSVWVNCSDFTYFSEGNFFCFNNYENKEILLKDIINYIYNDILKNI